MRVRTTICDFCHEEIKNNAEDFDFPFLGEDESCGHAGKHGHQIINLCPECIERIKQLKNELTPKNP